MGDNWLLVEWNNGRRDVVYIKSVLKPVNMKLEIGQEMTVNRKGEPEAAKLIARARERHTLEFMIKKDMAGPSKGFKQDEGEDFSSSASSWTPSDGDAQSDDSITATQENKNFERYRRQYVNTSNKKVLIPSNKANPIEKTTRKRSHNGTILNQNNSYINTPPTAKTNATSNMKMTKEVKYCIQGIFEIFKGIFRQVEDLKKPLQMQLTEDPGRYDIQHIITPATTSEEPINLSPMQTGETTNGFIDNEHSENEEFNRSDDNVLISNKYKSVTVKNETNRERESVNKEWIPIGSGKTLIHKDKFAKINWKSYTVATRTLLMAVFPRKVLATHSLTGKRSPAFRNKPAKMCLDPKKTSDIIMEIIDRFKVRENLVRGIITTKCADECKMWKMRNNTKKQNGNSNVEKTETLKPEEQQ